MTGKHGLERGVLPWRCVVCRAASKLEAWCAGCRSRSASRACFSGSVARHCRWRSYVPDPRAKRYPGTELLLHLGLRPPLTIPEWRWVMILALSWSPPSVPKAPSPWARWGACTPIHVTASQVDKDVYTKIIILCVIAKKEKWKWNIQQKDKLWMILLHFLL